MSPRPLREVRVFAPASVANLGVGFDVLGAALDGPGDTVTIRRTTRSGVRVVSVTGDGGRLPREADRNTASVAAALVLEAAVSEGKVASRTGLEIRLEKGLPLASGLGSSAASAAAGARAAATLLGVSRISVLLRAVLIAENVADGGWHGDNAFASLLGGLLLVPSSDPKRLRPPLPLAFPPELRLVLVHPKVELPTSEARAVLPRVVTLADHTQQAGALAGLVASLASGDLRAAGRYMSSDIVAEPRRAPLVRGYAEVMRAMRDAGAMGQCFAGAGPSLVALTEVGPAAARIAKAGAEAFRAEGIEADARVHAIDPDGSRVLEPSEGSSPRGVPSR